MKNKFLFLSALSFYIFFTSCKEKKDNTTAPQPICISDSMANMIQIDTVKPSDIEDKLRLTGEVGYDEDKTLKVFPFASGQVIQVNVSLGDKVSKGQTLAIMKSADVAGDYGDLSSRKSDLAIARREYDQAKSMFDNGLGSAKDLEEAKESYDKAQADVAKVESAISINGGGNTSANGSYIIRAPKDGYMIEKNVSAGSFIRADNATNLFTISDLKDVWITANVFEKDISKVQAGEPVEVTTLSYPNRIFHGKVDKMSETLDPETKVMAIRIVMPNDDLALKPEMFANIELYNQTTIKALAIPANAIVFDDGKNYVVTYKDRCNLDIKEVSIIKTIDSTSYVSGIDAGTEVISKNQILLYKAIIDQ